MISVVLVTFNSLSVLPKCIKALESCSSARDLQVILVDNYSSDGTWRWTEDYEENGEHPFMSLKRHRINANRGYARANNQGVALADGDTILFLNPDTVIGKNVISVCSDKLNSDRSIGAIGCRLVMSNGKLDRACRRSFPTLWNSFTRFSRLSLRFPQSSLFASYNLTYLPEVSSYEVDCLSGACLMTPKALYQSIGGFDEDYFMYGEDIDLCYRIKGIGKRIWYEGTETTIHLKGGNGGKRSYTSLKHFYGAMPLFFEKHYYAKYGLITCLMVRLSVNLLLGFHVCYQGLFRRGSNS